MMETDKSNKKIKMMIAIGLVGLILIISIIWFLASRSSDSNDSQTTPASEDNELSDDALNPQTSEASEFTGEVLIPKSSDTEVIKTAMQNKVDEALEAGDLSQLLKGRSQVQEGVYATSPLLTAGWGRVADYTIGMQFTNQTSDELLTVCYLAKGRVLGPSLTKLDIIDTDSLHWEFVPAKAVDFEVIVNLPKPEGNVIAPKNTYINCSVFK